MRLKHIKAVVVFTFAVLIACLWYIQCVQDARYKEMSYKNRIRLVPLAGPRGNIYDKYNNLLAGSRLTFDCAVIPQEFKAGDKRIEELSSILQIKSSSLKKKIRDNARTPFASAILKKDIGKKSAIAISERSVDFPGIIIQTSPRRYYPGGSIGSHITGYLGRISEEEITALKDYGYKTRDVVGRAGLELYYDNYLKGEDGGIQTEVDSLGRELRVLGIRDPGRGRDITLTIDLKLEKYIDSLLSGHKGAAIVMDSNSGGILALVSKPDFDPNLFEASNDSALIADLLGSKDYPLIDRAISGSYPPGSTFKVVTASAVLEMNKLKPDEYLNCEGFYILGRRRFNCWRKSGHGSQNISDAIKNSCNVFFYQAGLKAGVDGLADYAFRYGFGKPSGIDLPYEAGGVVPTRAWKKKHKKEPWYDGDTVNYSIGQGFLLVTPIQILRMVNAVGTEGSLVKPFLVKKIDSIEMSVPKKKRVSISDNTFKVIKEGMKRAVGEKRGTAGRVKVEGMQIAGKTGTSQTGTKRTHAWFAGFSPVEKSKISLVVFLEYGGKGGGKPSRIASNIFSKLKEMGYL